MGKMKRLMVAAVIMAVIVVMALRGCPRARRSAAIARNPATAGVTGISGTTFGYRDFRRTDFLRRQLQRHMQGPYAIMPVLSDSLPRL